MSNPRDRMIVETLRRPALRLLGRDTVAGQSSGAPSNALTAEDGTTYLMAENGTTYLTQES